MNQLEMQKLGGECETNPPEQTEQQLWEQLAQTCTSFDTLCCEKMRDVLKDCYINCGESDFWEMAGHILDIAAEHRFKTQASDWIKGVKRETAKLMRANRRDLDATSVYEEHDDATTWRFCGTSDDGTPIYKKLANFQVTPCCELTIDDGSGTPQRRFEFTGKLEGGRKLPKISVPAAEFDGLGWILKNWGLAPLIEPGCTNKQHFSAYIQGKSILTAHRTVYQHTGFREIDGKLCYLYHGGALGAEGVECELPEALHGYRLDGAEMSTHDAVRAVLRLTEFCPPELSMPLLGAVYLAPLREFLKGCTPAFALFIRGTTGTGKTTAAQLFLSHFYDYQGMTTPPPASFRSTANALERLAFALKDCVLLVDDYFPTDERDKRRMDDIAQKLARGAGDGASRLRMQSDTSMRPSYPPKCLSIITGEDLPNIGQSGVARFWVVDLSQPLTDAAHRAELTALQSLAAQGAFQQAMRGYLSWLIENAQELPELLREQYRALIDATAQDGHARFAANQGHLMLGVQMFARYAATVGVEQNEDRLCGRAQEVLNRQAAEQAQLGREEQPVRLFLDALRELLDTKRAYLLPKHTPEGMDTPFSSGILLGYECEEEEFLYLIPKTTMNAVREFYRGSNHSFTATTKKIKDGLDALGVLHYTQSGARNKTQNVKIGKNGQRQYIVLLRSALETEDA